MVAGVITYRRASRIQAERHAREAQEQYEMQRNRAAEAEKQIAAMNGQVETADESK